MFWLQRQFNNIVETTQLTNDQMPEFHCHCECSKCLPPAPTQAFSRFEKSFTDLSIGPCGRLPQITWSACLSSAIVFGFVLSCGKLPTLHPTHDSPLGSYPANLEATGLWWWNLDNWSAASSVRCSALRATCVLTRRPAGRWIQWAAGDCFKGRVI